MTNENLISLVVLLIFPLHSDSIDPFCVLFSVSACALFIVSYLQILSLSHDTTVSTTSKRKVFHCTQKISFTHLPYWLSRGLPLCKYNVARFCRFSFLAPRFPCLSSSRIISIVMSTFVTCNENWLFEYVDPKNYQLYWQFELILYTNPRL